MTIRTNGSTKFDLDVLLEQLERLAADPEYYVPTESERQRLLQVVRKTSIKLETPFDTVQRLGFCPLPLVAARIAQDHNIFSALAESSRDDPVGLDHLSAVSKIEPLFLETFMDYICTQYMAEHVSLKQYISTSLTMTLLQPLTRSSCMVYHDIDLPVFAKLSTFLRQSRFNSENGTRPSDSKHKMPPTVFQMAHNTNDDLYTWLTYNPEQSAGFYSFMTQQFAGLPTWLSVVDVPKEFGCDMTDNEVLMVDIGGGNGVQCTSLRTQYPDMKGRIVLQDRPSVIARAPIDRLSIETQEYDYFQPQPIRDARIYYLRQILHNNDDATCVTVLRNQVSAMSSSTSVLVIDEKALPDSVGSVNEYAAGLSILMKCLFNAQERREAHWRRLVASAGLEVVSVRRFTGFHDAAIICKKKTSKLLLKGKL